ncbi:MAG: hypothetical protein R6U36_04540 [Candidatus Fermentibacteraceae bacterium]
MAAVRGALDLLFDAVTWPLGGTRPLWGLILVSLLSGLWMILLFKTASPQRAIKRLRRRMGAQALGMLLYLSSPLQVLRLAGGLLWSNFLYLGMILLPLAVIALPFGLTYGQLEARYGRGYPAAGDTLTATVEYAVDPPGDEEVVSPSRGLAPLPPLVTIDSLRQVSFRLRLEETAPRSLATAGEELPVGRRSLRSGSIVYSGAETPSAASVFRPGNMIISPEARDSLRSFRVSIPGRDYHVLWRGWSWLAVFLVFSTLSAVAGAIVFKVRV